MSSAESNLEASGANENQVEKLGVNASNSPPNEYKLGRRYSTPTRPKSSKINCSILHEFGQRKSERIARHLSLIRHQKHRDSLGFRTFDRHQRRNQSQHHDHSDANVDLKSDSPASSSASDSAFSQSQTTLESEGKQSTSCLRGSLNDSGRSIISAEGTKSSRRFSSDSNIYGCNDSTGNRGDHSNLTLSDEDEDPDRFKIIWRDLSYRVPEKRCARAIDWLQRSGHKLWPFNRVDDDERVDEDHIVNHLDEQCPRKLPSRKPREAIFSQLNGCIRSGQLTAILGPSGAGKTTFLKCLTNSIQEGVVGSIEVTGGQATSHHLKLCIIPQKDYLFDNLTVMENLVFASRIKNPQSNFNHDANVHRVAALLGLQACLKLKTSRLSGGQYKRVSIAQELLSKPDILILDEPTSGLDSLTCFRTVSVLRDLVCKSRARLMPPLAIVMTIHQPQVKIFNLFHHVYILSSQGRCIYEGHPEFVMDTVSDCCKLLPPPDDMNPASFIINLASEVYGSKPVHQLTKLQRENFDIHHNVVQVHAKSDILILDNIEHFVSGNQQKMCSNPNVTLNFEEETPKYIESSQEIANVKFKMSSRLKKRHSYNGSFWSHTWLLVKRLWISMWRDPLLTTTRVTFHLIIPFVFYFIYSQKSGAANACPYIEREIDIHSIASEATIKRLGQQHDEMILTFENVSLFFLLLYSFSMCVLAVTALSFPLSMQILLKETSNGWYSMSRFVMAKTLADLPMELTMPMTSVAVAYVLTGQPGSYLCWRMLTVTAVMTLCSLISQTQGLLFGAYFMHNVQAAVFVSQASSIPWIMLSGFTTRISELPRVLQWLSFGSIYRLGIESIVAVRYGFGMCPCDEELVNDTPVKMVGISDQLRSVMRYYIDVYSEPSVGDISNSSTKASNSSQSEDIFETIATTLSRANTFGVDISNCHDVRPFIMSAREVDETTLTTFLLILVVIFIALKLLLFCVVRVRASN